MLAQSNQPCASEVTSHARFRPLQRPRVTATQIALLAKSTVVGVGFLFSAQLTTSAQTCSWTPAVSGLGCVTSDATATSSICPSLTIGSCRKITVDHCPSVEGGTNYLPPRNAFLMIGEPSPGTVEQGTIVLMVGGDGGGWYELASNSPHSPAVSTPASADLVKSMQDIGFRTIQIAWDADVSPASRVPWWASAAPTPVRQEGMLRAACRPATLFRYLFESPSPSRYFTSGRAFCGAGNSSGAAQLAYSLASYGQGGNDPSTGDQKRIFDAVIVSNGPPFSDLFDSCTGSVPTTGPSESDANFELVTGTGAGKQGRGSIDYAFGEIGSLGPCYNDPYTPTSACAPNPPGTCSSRSSILSDSSIKSSLSNAVFAYPHVSIVALRAGDWTDKKSTYPQCSGNGNLAPCCPSLSSSQCTASPPVNCCFEGDNEYGSSWSAKQYSDLLAALSGHGPVDAKLLGDQEHSIPSRVNGAHAIRDALTAECHLQQ